jgi:hypothetical protein
MEQGRRRQKVVQKRFVISVLVVLLQVHGLFAAERYSILKGTVRGIHLHGLKKWLEVENEQDKSVMNFRIGKNTVYTPHRAPQAGERVKVEYLTHKGVPVAYTVTILEGQK